MYYYGFRFYDPNLQRWLNRDPLAERGGINLYTMVGNNPITQIDAEGREIFTPPVLWPPGPRSPVLLTIVLRCGVPYYTAASLKYSDDKMRHCWASCSIARACGKGIALAGDLAKEFGDMLKRGYDYNDSKEDMAANAAGLHCAGWEAGLPMPFHGVCYLTRLFRKSCEQCCMQKGYTP
jgi:uncharacterized protein RhaS with RHS repeats